MINGDDGFTLVTRKPRATHKLRPLPLIRDSTNLPIDPEAPRDFVIKQVLSSKAEVESSHFFKGALCSLQQSLDRSGQQKVEHLLCYGLGCFARCTAARHQLGFLLALIAQIGPCTCLLYDPLFSELERELLTTEFGLSLIETNEEGKRVIEGCTLVFAPHCPKQLTNNLLWANWQPERLARCLLLANSFSAVAQNPACQPETAQFLLRVLPLTSEVPLKNCFRLPDVFNDLAFHSFETKKVRPEFWLELPAPEYPENDTGKVICGNGRQS
ncbi:SRR1-like protein [Neocloeon triangulifer]|uniref:SRR1-like protein n=1 Tax=Neocloeon triangulifer TaxID=2078957 RepID=UPI00286F3455|nr:SRR1-like protein [Neocloeon triangulifer]